jgi:hypothetical protein
VLALFLCGASQPSEEEAPELLSAPVSRFLASTWQRQTTVRGVVLPSFPDFRAVDGELSTSWGTGRAFSPDREWITLYFDEPIFLARLQVAIGIQAQGSPNFLTNGRPCDVRLEFSDGSYYDTRFLDVLGYQDKDIPPVWTRWVRLRIRSIYEPASIEAGVNDDVGIAEIKAYRLAARPEYKPRAPRAR